MEEQKEKMNLKRLVIMIVLVLITALMVGGLVWYLMDKNTKSIISENNKALAAIEKQTKEKKTTANSSTAQNTTPSISPNVFTPVVVFSPAGLFTETEKVEIKSKITNAYIAYHNENGLDTIAIIVKKYQESERPQGHWYGIESISKTGGNEGWLVGLNGVISYWMPTCMGDCSFSSKFKQEYPNNVPK